MPKDLILDLRLEEGDNLEEAAYLGVSQVLEAVTSAWASGKQCPGKDAYIEKTNVVDEEGARIGFNYYLVWDEPRPFQVRTEVDKKESSGS